MTIASSYLSEVLVNNLKYGYCKPKIVYGSNSYTSAESDIVIPTISDKANNAVNAVMNFVRC